MPINSALDQGCCILWLARMHCCAVLAKTAHARHANCQTGQEQRCHDVQSAGHPEVCSRHHTPGCPHASRAGQEAHHGRYFQLKCFHCVIIERDGSRSTRRQATTPNRRPTAAVSAMASAPQKATRAAAGAIDAPPARAASPPSTARNRSEDMATAGMSW